MATSSALNSFPLHRLAIALIAGGVSVHAAAQSTAANANTQATSPALPSVVVKGASEASVMVGGFGDTPAAKLPIQTSIVSAEQLTDRGLLSLAGLTLLDASVGDSYNSAGYVSYLKIRGYDQIGRAHV